MLPVYSNDKGYKSYGGGGALEAVSSWLRYVSTTDSYSPSHYSISGGNEFLYERFAQNLGDCEAVLVERKTAEQKQMTTNIRRPANQA